jgi:intergrase/recombinase
MEQYVSLVQRLDIIEDNVKEIKDALIGNEFTKDGLIHSHNQMKARLERLERRWDAIKYWVIGLALGSGVGLTKIVDLLNKL